MGRSVSCPYSFCELPIAESKKEKTYYQTLVNEISDNNATMRYWYLIDEGISERAEKSTGFWSGILDSFLKNFKY